MLIHASRVADLSQATLPSASPDAGPLCGGFDRMPKPGSPDSRTDSSKTHRWSKPDSNPQSHCAGSGTWTRTNPATRSAHSWATPQGKLRRLAVGTSTSWEVTVAG